jgi:hypothetical protein
MVEIEWPERKRRRREKGKCRCGSGDIARLKKIRVTTKTFGFRNGVRAGHRRVFHRRRRGGLRVFQCSVVLHDQRLSLFALCLLFDEFRRIEVNRIEFIGLRNSLRVVIVAKSFVHRTNYLSECNDLLPWLNAGVWFIRMILHQMIFDR